MSAAELPAAQPDWGRLQRIALIVAVVGILLFVGLSFTPAAGTHKGTQWAVSYLVAFNFLLGVPLGCLVLLMMQYLTGGAWGVLLRPVLESSARTLLLLVLLFVPLVVAIFLGSSALYPWARPLEQVAHGEVLDELRAKTWLLNRPFFIIRAAIYFIFLGALVYFLKCWAARWRSGDEAVGSRLPTLSGPGLVVYGIIITFASIDWVMSLEPFWHSTIYPPLYAVGQVTTGLAFATMALILLSRYPPLAGRVRPVHLRDLGSLMLTFVIFWAYLAFSQYLLMWVGNLSDEIPYYLKRSRGGWQWVALVIIGLHFAVPFVVLLFTGARESARWMFGIALGMLVLRFVDTLWWIEPAFPHDGPGLFWLLDVAATVGIGGLWVWWFANTMKRMPLLDEPTREVPHE